MLSPPPYESPNPIFNEQGWIIHIRRALEDGDDLEQESDIHVSIFNVPKTLVLTSPESYVPQLVALGPYHHSRPELYEMERYKLSAAKKSLKEIPGLKFHNLVGQLSRAEHRFRACYHKFINLNGETLAWMMAVDSCFLLQFIRAFAVDEGPGRKSGHHDAILRDIVMLENQVPLFSVKKTLEFMSGSAENGADDQLYAMVIGLCRYFSPFVMIQESGGVDRMNKSAHFLEFLYNLTVPGFQSSSEIKITLGADEQGPNKVVSSETGPLSLMKRLMLSRPVRIILTLPWKIVSNLPGVIMLRQVNYFCFSREKDEINNSNDDNNNNNISRHPLMEEITIPSVTELSNAGVRFATTNSGISSIHFDEKTATFHLAAISIDVNTEAVMRNLVAYEACWDSSRPLICARYTELMNGIIDSEDDAMILREKGIILNHLKSDQDVANLWNGMSKSIRLTKVPFLDRVIEDVNSYYEGRWKVRIGKFLKVYVSGSWQSMTFLAAILLLFFVSLQAFSSIFGCARVSFRRGRAN
ncbi:hypothetical protein C2S53_017494 [Perilla frutescens var. hirtella]|uniref:Uncharacterized protein n=1 Tax=Perilla frutescens var. hirtella TaxID=608512 RepID=A0AAD4NVR1_PERFH|nr:hypothetical protein C2S53_017494 [Perilla frutescens var. hirtella]